MSGAEGSAGIVVGRSALPSLDSRSRLSPHEAVSLVVSFWELVVVRVPSPSRSIGVIDIAGNLEIIYGAQQLRGKILSRRDLAPSTGSCLRHFRLGYDLLFGL
jgi:hypothetical protein